MATRSLNLIWETLVGLLLLTLAAIGASAAQISTFPVPGRENSWAFGVNDKGYVVGTAGDSLDLGHATGVLYGKGHVTWLGSSFFYNGSPDHEYGVFTFATATNNAGLIVGGEVMFGGSPSGFYTYQSAFLFNGNLNSIPVGDPNTTATAINNKGQIVGHYDNFYGGGFRVIGPERGYLIDAGQAIDIVPPNHDSDSTYLSSINDIGQIVGVTTATPSPVARPRPSNGASTSSAGSDLPFAFLYANGTYTDLGSLGGGGSDPGDINNEGKIIGYSYLSNGARHAFLYSNGGMTDLGTLGGTFSQASSINNQGEIIGESTLADGTEVAFLYANGRMIDLNSFLPVGSGWRLNQA
ncbi:MAG TPA: hypothetical protein VH351_10120, partial [Bryobacteraceae bacterium]|nr:hypothetical protein [Bryobacteraceae bacterium]